MSHYVGVPVGHSYDVYNYYLFARFLGEVVDRTGNKTLCEELRKHDIVSICNRSHRVFSV